MAYRTTIFSSTAIALALAGTAFAQDATIHYSVPIVQSGQPVDAAVPVITPVPVYTPVVTPAAVTPEGYPVVAPTAPSADDAEYLGTPKTLTSDADANVTFATGGIGASEKQWFDQHGGEFALKVEYSDTTGHHLAGVEIKLADASGKTVLATTTKGPYLLVKAKPGTYSLTSTYEGDTQTKKVTLGKGTAKTSVTFTEHQTGED